MASTMWQAASSAPDFWVPGKLAWDGGSSRNYGIGCEEWYDKGSGSETTEAEPEPVPYADSEARLPPPQTPPCTAESMLPVLEKAGLLEEIGTDLHEGSTKPPKWTAGGRESQPVDVSTTVNMLSSVLGKHASLHYEADGRMISVTGGNDFRAEKKPPAAPSYAAPARLPPVPPGPPAPQVPPAEPVHPVQPAWQEMNYPMQDLQPEAYYQGYGGYYPAMYGQYQESVEDVYAQPAQPVRSGAAALAQCTPGRFCVFCGKPKHSLTQRFCSHCGEMVVA